MNDVLEHHLVLSKVSERLGRHTKPNYPSHNGQVHLTYVILKLDPAVVTTSSVDPWLSD